MSFGNSLLDCLIVMAAVLFIVNYWRSAPWWQYVAGRALMFLAFSVALIPFPKVLSLLTGMPTHSSFYAWSQLLCKAPVVIALLWIAGTQLRVQWEGDNGVPHRCVRCAVREATGEGTDSTREGMAQSAAGIPAGIPGAWQANPSVQDAG